ncbi:hypothetical protein CHGG_04546 [Chaetomium globosum CBS 148.51]|uniref:Uncharacterized protein n=1 Tax=Chaetomium globosum (strain ATCC 6205 / CBS 148.51 / DSM 1962 / NBRC 6347 / NRRL 1970) TaxID=306901 RepID=Q2H100_CHAGB|nr:uncharacterized protein CHGG_04546 [Chaetomium globosum CBS 148.51]EAQ87927.1 hypothetical protein CHGG_04546 [Chaetomium globosum CBS 148.51]
MGGSQPPFMYQSVSRDDERFPAVKFDPKAVTRASYESKKPKPKPDGPLVSFNRHPDALMVPNGRKQKYSPMGQRTKSWIKGMRVVQMCLRVVQAIAAVGLIVAMSVSGLVGWVVIGTCAIVILHCIYSVFHHVRPAGARTPGSSAGYQFFAGLSDLCVLPLYAYGAIMTRNKNEEWKTTAPPDDPDVVKYMVPSVFYGLIGAGGLHLISLAISLWLGLMFRRIAYMPPDMNPLEANLTSRVHKRNKSSVTTTSTYSDEKRESELYDGSSSPPAYQVPTSNRNSTTSQDLKRMSAPPPPAHRASYTEIPLGETGASSARPVSVHSSCPSTGSVPSYRAEPVSPAQTVQPRSAKFTETWYASESLINRTQQRNRATPTPKNKAAYASLDASDGDDNSDSENDTFYTPARGTTTNNENANHPNPLRSNPLATNDNTTATPTTPRRPRTPFSRLRNSVLSTISPNDRRVSGSQDITDQTHTHSTKALAIGSSGGPRNRLSSIQPDGAFFLETVRRAPRRDAACHCGRER